LGTAADAPGAIGVDRRRLLSAEIVSAEMTWDRSALITTYVICAMIEPAQEKQDYQNSIEGVSHKIDPHAVPFALPEEDQYSKLATWRTQ